TRKASSSGLLALIRYFIKNDFEVVAVSQRKYTMDTTVTHKFAIEHLEKLGLIHLVDGHEYDDIVALEIAFAADGVIVSNDQFAYVDFLCLSPTTFRKFALFFSLRTVLLHLGLSL
ncbi:hypothetical protein NECAME_05906, partial [Necator americanus]